ncbi:MAG: 16S rRNA (cytosine(967)-C(5))-methyltransferase RsmB [Hungatella sp.]|nr:16S rRNA (cytosine(967)-C(5))-methyltransferase RsmB [Hungatella sp.]
MNVRELALDILMEVLERGGLSHVVLNQALSKYQYLEKQDRAFVTRVTEGTLEYLIQIDYVIGQYSKTKIEKMKPLIRTLLRMSVYQILYMDRIPDSAVCDEAVKLAVKRRFQGLKGFVNGVLRAIARGKGELVFPDDSVRYSMPGWLIDMWKKEYPETVVYEMLNAFLEKRRLCVRLKGTPRERQRTEESLQSQGAVVEKSEYSEEIRYLSGIDHLEALAAFRDGWIQVQDLSSSFVALAAAPRKGQYCVDVCAAPGGKSLHMADLLGDQGFVEARDISQNKIALIEDNIRRHGVSNIRTRVMDALEFDQESAEKADILLADLPCSGLGILGRKPDIKYRVSPESIVELAELQRKILSVVWRYVKPQGTLVYSTCTISRKENEENAAWFAEEYPFEPVNIEQRLGGKLRSETLKKGYIQLLPGAYPGDGFFLEVFKRI